MIVIFQYKSVFIFGQVPGDHYFLSCHFVTGILSAWRNARDNQSYNQSYNQSISHYQFFDFVYSRSGCHDGISGWSGRDGRNEEVDCLMVEHTLFV